MKRMHKFWGLTAAGLLAIGGLWGTRGGRASAQDNPPQAPPAPKAPDQGQNRENGRERMQNMTPEERRAAVEKRMKEALMRQGLTEQEVDVLKQFQQTRDAAQTSLVGELRKLGQTVRAQGTTDDQARTAVSQYREAMKTYQNSLEQARAKLDESVHYSTRPKIEALLLTLGILDNGVPGGGRGMMGRGMNGGGGRGGGAVGGGNQGGGRQPGANRRRGGRAGAPAVQAFAPGR